MRKTKNRKTRNRKTRNRNRIIGGAQTKGKSKKEKMLQDELFDTIDAGWKKDEELNEILTSLCNHLSDKTLPKIPDYSFLLIAPPELESELSNDNLFQLFTIAYFDLNLREPLLDTGPLLDAGQLKTIHDNLKTLAKDHSIPQDIWNERIKCDILKLIIYNKLHVTMPRLSYHGFQLDLNDMENSIRRIYFPVFDRINGRLLKTTLAQEADLHELSGFSKYVMEIYDSFKGLFFK